MKKTNRWKRFLAFLLAALLLCHGMVFPTMAASSVSENRPVSFSSEDLVGEGDAAISLQDFKVSLLSGATKIAERSTANHEEYVWEANTASAGHKFIFNVIFSTGGDKEIHRGELSAKIPKSILIDKNKRAADNVEMPYPEISGLEELQADPSKYENIDFVYYIEGDEIIIVNAREMTAGSTNEFDVSYETSETSFDYHDYGHRDESGDIDSASNAFWAEVHLKHQLEDGQEEAEQRLRSQDIVVHIDTKAHIRLTNKGYPTLFYDWSSDWGSRPADADNYYYLLWEIRTQFETPTQLYDFQLADELLTEDNGDGIVGYRISGSADKSFQKGEDNKSPILKNTQSSAVRFDYVLTRHAKENFAREGYQIDNKITATVHPAENVDENSEAVSTKTFVYTLPKFDPPASTATFEKYGDEHWELSREHRRREYSSYDLKHLQTSENEKDYIEPLRYNIHVNGFPYEWALPEEDDRLDANSYGKHKVTYQLTDENLYLLTQEQNKSYGSRHYGQEEQASLNALRQNGRSVALAAGDYDFREVEYSIYVAEASYNDRTKTFDKNNSLRVLNADDVISWYIKTADNEEWQKAATYSYGEKGADILLSAYVEAVDDKHISFKDGVIGYRADVENGYYNTTLDFNPSVRLYATDHVKALADEKQSVMILKNVGTMQVFNEEQKLAFNHSRMDGDRIREIDRYSTLNKRILSSSNDTTKRSFSIAWEIEQMEKERRGAGEADEAYIDQNGGIFYDLLPSGATLQKSSVKVTGENGEVLDAGEYALSQTLNYRNSGRTMVRLEIYAQKSYYRVTYSTRHNWDNIRDLGNGINNPVAYETGNATISDGFKDNGGNLDDENRAYYKDVDSESDAARFLYAESGTNINAVTAALSGLDKKVISEADEDWSYHTLVTHGTIYSYRLRFANVKNQKTKNIVLYDSLENFHADGEDHSKWRGHLTDIDLSQLKKIGADPKVYLSTAEHLNLSGDTSAEDASLTTTAPANADLENAKLWSEMTDRSQLAKAKAIAIQLNPSFELPAGHSFSVVLYMQAPENIDTDDVENAKHWDSFNEVYMFGIVQTVDGDSEVADQARPVYLNQSHTTVSYHIKNMLRLHKVSAESAQTSIPNITFRLSGTSNYGETVDQTAVTNSFGNIVFDDIEWGEYVLQEIGGSDDYLEDHTEHQVSVDISGTVRIDGRPLSGIYEIENRPRIHTDVEFYKRSMENGESGGVGGAVFRLTGTSHYGNDIRKTAQSSAGSGQVIFANLEWGDYEMEEITAAPDYIKAKVKWEVKVDSNGNAVIREKGAAGATAVTQIDQYDRTLLYNEKYHELSLIKESGYDGSALSGAVFLLTGTSDYGNVYEERVTSNTSGQARFTKLESGTYILQEVQAPEGYLLDDTKRIVSVGADGSVSMEGITADAYQNFVLTNQKAATGQIVVTKKWVDENAQNRPTPQLHIEETRAQASASGIEAAASMSRQNDDSLLQRFLDVVTGTIKANAGTIISGGAGQGDVASVNHVIWEFDPDTETLVFKKKEGVQEGIIGNSERLWQRDQYALKAKVKHIRFEENISVYSFNNMFAGFSALEDVDFTNLRTTTGTTAMSGMFDGCRNLRAITGMDTLDASKVTTMQNMFRGCSSLTSVDLSNWNTSRLTNLWSTFEGCKSLESIEGLNTWDVSKVTHFVTTFKGCTSLKSLDLSGWTNVTTEKQYTEGMFQNCTTLQSVDLSRFIIRSNTSTSSSLGSTFGNCNNLTKVKLNQNFYFNNGDLLPSKTDAVYSGRWVPIRPTSMGGLEPADFITLSRDGTVEITIDGKSYTYTKADLNGWWYRQVSKDQQKETEEYTSRADAWFDLNAYKGAAPSTIEAARQTFSTPDANGNTGYWQKVDDNTWSYTFYVIDADKNWYVWEDDLTGYQSDHPQSKKLLCAGTGSAVVTNTLEEIANRTYGNLTLSKAVSGNDDSRQDRFHFTVKLTAGEFGGISGTKIFGSTAFKDGVANVSLQAGESITFGNIPVGTEYEITEGQAENYVLQSIQIDGKVQETTAAKGKIETKDQTESVTFTNEYQAPKPAPTADLKIQKAVNGTADGDISYSFTLYATNLEPKTDYEFDLAGASGEAKTWAFTTDDFGAGSYHFSLKANESLVLKELPIGMGYRIEEAGGSYTTGYRLADANNLGKISRLEEVSNQTDTALSTREELVDEGEEVTVTFTNTPVQRLEGHKLVISKTVEGKENDTAEYAFLLELTDLPAGMTLRSDKGDELTANGRGQIEATYFLKDGEKISFDPIPAGARYRVTEQANLLKASYQLLEGTFGADGSFTTEEMICSGENEKRETALATGNASGVSENDSDMQTMQDHDILAAFTNTDEGSGNLQISKKVAGNMGSRSEEFSFSVKISEAEGEAFNERLMAKRWIGNAEPKEANTFVIFTDGVARLSLSHDTHIKLLGIPTGMRYEVSEVSYAHEGYETTVAAESENGTIDATDERTVKGEMEQNQNVICSYTNTKEIALPTMARGGMPILMATAAAAGGIWWMRRKKRQKDYDLS